MKYKFLHCLGFFVMVAVFTVLAGCAGTQPSKFYTLSTLQDTRIEKDTIPADQDVSVGVGPITIPDALKRPQIVTLTSQNELALAEFDRWAGALEDNMATVISENLSMLLSTDNVHIYPWSSSVTIDYQLEVDIVRFDGKLGESAVLVARWTMFTENGKKMLMKKRVQYIDPTEGHDYGALVAAMSRALADFSRDIAAEISSFSRK
jgi:uncharacterized lipoprotein YmbA